MRKRDGGLSRLLEAVKGVSSLWGYRVATRRLPQGQAALYLVPTLALRRVLSALSANAGPSGWRKRGRRAQGAGR